MRHRMRNGNVRMNFKNGNSVIKGTLNSITKGLYNDLYDMCSDLYAVHEGVFTEIYNKVVESYNTNTIKTSDDLINSDVSEFMHEIMQNHEDEIKSSTVKVLEFICDAPQITIEKCRKLGVVRSEDDFNMMKQRCATNHHDMKNQVRYFLEGPIAEFTKNMDEYLYWLLEFTESQENTEDDNEIQFNTIEDDKGKKHDIQKIYSYEEMAKLAKSNNYEYKRSKGDHDIYEHKDSKKIIVIPAHSLGLGLSIKIQKQIYNNAC